MIADVDISDAVRVSVIAVDDEDDDDDGDEVVEAGQVLVLIV